MSTIKGEGGANVVYAFHSQEDGTPQVLRIRKKKQIHETPRDPPLMALEREVWARDFKELKGDLHTLHGDVFYINTIMAPVLGHQYIVPQHVIALSGNEIDLYGAYEGVVMPDVTCLPIPKGQAGSGNTSQTLSVEIKPKFGGLPTCDTVLPRNRPIKHSKSRYRLHQLYKVAQGKITEPGHYDPIDFFSGETMRMEAALHALFEHPQNNLTLFLNGRRLPSHRGTNSYEEVLGSTNARPSEGLIAVLRSILQQEEVLQRLLGAQMMCPYDIEGVYVLYLHLLHGSSTMPREDDDHDIYRQREKAIARLVSLPRAESLAVLRSYCIAATAKDCSVMISLRWEVQPAGGACAEVQGPGWSSEACGFVGDPCKPGYMVRYKVTIVDLDRKSLEKIPGHRQLDLDILAAARTILDADSLRETNA